MKNFKHAYWVNKDNVPCYAMYTTPPPELEELILNNKCIILDEPHDFCKTFDKYFLFLPAYIFDYDNKTISLDMNIASSIVLNIIKKRRNEILQELDTEQLKCLTNPDKLNKIEIVKQQLRDLPIQLNNSLLDCKTITDLNHVLPPILITYKEML